MQKGYITFVLVAIGLLAFFLATGFINSPNIPYNGTKYVLATPTPYGGKESLQLHTLAFITIPPDNLTLPPEPSDTPPPISGTYCQRESQKLPNCQCVPTEKIVVFCPQAANFCTSSPSCPDNGNVVCQVHNWTPPPPTCSYNSKNPSYAKYLNNPSCLQWCVGKPVIYLYPDKPEYVNVKLLTPGNIYISIPFYPENGWKNIFSFPNGTLIYQQKTYHELYYETSINNINPPQNGIIIPSENLYQKLTQITKALGLITHEQEEFLNYWMPKLENLHKPYILFSVISPSEKNRIDSVELNPSPETRIEFLAYFKGLDAIENVQPLILPSTPPSRKGFTEVEWGGTIDPR